MSDVPDTGATALAPPAAAPTASQDHPRRRKVKVRRWGCAALALALAFGVLGVAPMSLALRVFGLAPQDFFTGLPAPFYSSVPAGSLQRVPGLALPQQAWVAESARVYRSPTAPTAFATLGAGFPVTVTDARLAGTVRWDHVTWIGPTPATGGSGWVSHTSLTSVAEQGTATADAGALSPALAAALSALGPRAGLVVYYPGVQQTYTSDADVAFPLGDGVRGMLEADLLASPLASRPTIAGQPEQRVVQGVASGEAGALSLVYAQLGGSAQLSGFLQSMGIGGVTLDQLSWSAATATPRSLAQFYAALGGITPIVGGPSTSERAQSLAALEPGPDTIALAGWGTPLPQGASVVLVTGTAQAVDGWSMNVAGIITAPSGLRYVVAVCVRAQSSADAAQMAVRDLLQRVAAVATA